MKKFSLFSLLIVTCSIMLACGNDNKQQGEQEIKPRTKIVVGLEGDYTPYNWTTLAVSEDTHPFTGQSGNASGYDVMIAKRVAEALEMELEIKKISWDGLIMALNSGNIDLIIAGMSPTAERMRAISFTDPYYQGEPELVIVVRGDGAYAQASKRSDFAGANITAQQGTYHADLLTQLPDIKRSTLLTDFVALMQSLKSGVIDGYLAERVVAEEHLRANSDFVMIPLTGEEALKIPLDQSATSIGMRKDDNILREKINGILAGISQEERDEMMNRAKELANNL